MRIEKYVDRIRNQLIDDRFDVLVIEISINDFVMVVQACKMQSNLLFNDKTERIRTAPIQYNSVSIVQR